MYVPANKLSLGANFYEINALDTPIVQPLKKDPSDEPYPNPGTTYPFPATPHPQFQVTECTADDLSYEQAVECFGKEDADEMERDQRNGYMTVGGLGGGAIAAVGLLIAATPPGWVAVGVVVSAAAIGAGLGWLASKIW